MNRILVIRGGAIGDFILTLPAIKLLRDRFPQSHLEILGYPHIVALARNRSYADAIHSIESRSLAPFFARGAALPAELGEYFGSFDLIVSYLFDPEGIFRNNLSRCGIKMFLAGPSKLSGHEHAALQLARPLEQIGIHLENPAARIHPTELDREFVQDMLGNSGPPVIALHPGSGSETKNWPIEKWKGLGEHLFSTDRRALVIAGEADEERVRLLEIAWRDKPVRFVKNLPGILAFKRMYQGQAFVSYRGKKGNKTGVLPDFFIGAHAAVAGLPLLTQDTSRYTTYFPTLELIAPPRAK
jgi:heptosyltransferase-2